MDSYPPEWTKTTLGTIAKSIFGGGTPSTKNPDFWKGNIPWITSRALGESIYLTVGDRFISEDAVANSATQIVPAGNIIFGTRVGVGKVAVTLIDVAISQDSTGILINPEEINPTFLAYQLRSSYVQQFIEQNKRGATIQGITRDTLKEIEIFIPPLPEQRKIASVLSLVQKAIEQQERLIALTTELKKALMRKLFTEGVRGEPQKMTEIGPIPESWEVVELGKILTLVQYGLSVRGNENGNYPIIRMTNQINGKIVLKELQRVNIDKSQVEKFLLKRGDILFNRTNSFELVGRTAIFDIEGDYVFASYLIRLRVDQTRLNPYFLNHHFNSDITQQRLKSIATRAVSQSNISATRLKGFLIPLPDIAEQGRIVEILDLVDSKIENHEQRRSVLQSLFRTLLHQLMTAQIRVVDLELEELEGVNVWTTDYAD